MYCNQPSGAFQLTRCPLLVSGCLRCTLLVSSPQSTFSSLTLAPFMPPGPRPRPGQLQQLDLPAIITDEDGPGTSNAGKVEPHFVTRAAIGPVWGAFVSVFLIGQWTGRDRVSLAASCGAVRVQGNRPRLKLFNFSFHCEQLKGSFLIRISTRNIHHERNCPYPGWSVR